MTTSPPSYTTPWDTIYRVSLNYKPNDDVLIFANHSTGYKSAGYNSGGGVPSLTTFDAGGNLVSTKRLFDRESVKNYELGIKSSWLDRLLKLNLTLYRMDIAGFQDRAFDGVSFVVRNAGNLRQQGFEFDTTIAPNPPFLGFGIGCLPRFEVHLVRQCFTPAGPDRDPGSDRQAQQFLTQMGRQHRGRLVR